MAAGGVLVGRGYVSIRPEFEGDWSRQASARASRAGRSGAGAFSKSFSGGLKGIGVLAGVAVAANLQNVAAAAAVMAPALATAGTAAAALKLGLSGVGDAFKAAFADSSAQASSAASATRAVESAQRGLANAQRALADARVQAAERVRDAQEQVTDAERDLADAQRDARQVQGELNDARREAARALEDMNQRLAESQLDEREAVLRLKQAEEELKAAQRKPGTSPDELAKLQIARDRAALNLKEQQRDTKRLADDTKKANKAGVEGSQQVLSVKERISAANRTVADRERALAEAHADVDKARAEGARSIEDAQRAVAEAAAAVADAQAAAAAQTSKLDTAMAKLAPNARSFVNAVRGLSPAWTAMRLSVQNRLFEDLDSTVTALGRQTIPILQRQLTDTAGIWNTMAKSAAGAVSEMARSGMLEQILQGANRNLRAFEQIPGKLVTAFGQLSVAAQPAMERLSGQFAGAIAKFTDGIAKGFASGGLEQGINTAFEILSQFGQLLGNILGTIGQIFKAASDAGGQIVGALSAVFGELRRVLGLPEVQAQLRALFTSVAQIVAAIVPIFGALVQAIVPVLAAIAPAVASIATAAGPMLQQLATVIGTSLLPIIETLMPVVTQVGLAIVQVVQAVMPLLQPIAALITSVISALAPALTPVIDVVTRLVGVLVGPLSSVVTALTPALVMMGEIVVQVFQAFEPFLTPLVQLLGQVAGLLAGVFAQALGILMSALQPIITVGMQLIDTVLAALTPLLPVIGDAFEVIGEALLTMLGPMEDVWGAAAQLVQSLIPLVPIGVDLVSTVFQALVPILPTIADAFVAITEAVLAIFVPMSGLITQLAQSLAPVIADLAPVLGQLATILAETLAAALPPLTDALIILFDAFSPLFPLIGDILGMVIDLGLSVFMDLLPPLLDLVQAGVDLALALLPIVPPLAELVGLVLELAINVLSWLLPPIIDLAGFFVGAFSSALSTVIGWISGLIRIVASLITWVRDKLGPVFQWLNDRIIQPVWRAIRTAIKWAWDNVIRPVWQAISNWIHTTLAPAMKTLQDKVALVWKGIRTAIKWAWDNVINPVFSSLKTAIGKVSGAFKTAKDAISEQWSKLADIAKKPIAFVINTVYNKGIVPVWNKVITTFGGKPLAPFHPKGFATGGAVFGAGTATSDSIPAMLSRGEHVWTAKEVEGAGGHGAVLAMRDMAGRGALPGFKNGGIVDDVLAGLSGAAKTVGNVVVGTADLFANPGEMWTKLTGPIRNLIKGMGDSPWIKAIGRLPMKMMAYLKDELVEAAGSVAGGLAEAVGLGSSGGGGSGVKRWTGVVQQSLRMLGQPAGYTGLTLRRMNQESGGNPTIVNKWDSNWLAGHPSVGLMQVIGPTFRSYAGKMRGTGPFSYGVSVNPLANVYASMRYALSRYGSLPRAYNRPGGYDAGGWLGPGQVGVNHLRQPEAVLTPGQWQTMATLAASGGGLQAGDKLRLVVRDHEFEAYLEAVADGRVDATLRPAITAMRANRRG